MALIIILAIVVSIALGYKTKLNTGLFAMAFAYIIGCFFMDLSAREVIGYWPIRIFYVIFAVSLFYSFAITNGTLEKMALHLLFRCQRFPSLLPFAIFLSSTLIAAMGAGFYTVIAFMAPLTLLLCNKTGMSKVIAAMVIYYGALAGANFMTSQSGVIFRGLMEGTGVDANSAFINATSIFIWTMLIPIALLSVYVSMGRSRIVAYASEKPEPFDPKQKITLYLIITMMSTVLLGPILSSLFPSNQTIVFINAKLDIGLIAVSFSIIALLLKLAEERQVIALIPWSTLIMICGVGMLISVAIKAGTIDILASWVGRSIPVMAIPLVLCLIAAAMSLFSSTLGVVTPALFPIVPAIAAASGHSSMLLFACIVIGAQSSAISPFSSGGSLILGACSSDQERVQLFPQLLFRAVPLGVMAGVIAVIIAGFII